MKRYFREPIIYINSETYLTVVVILSAILNFLAGINIDIYSPSMPTIANDFNVSSTVVKNTITITLVGWTIGAIVFGILIDSLGRRNILIISLFCYVVASFLAPLCQQVEFLMLVRFIQGFMTAAITIGCRALVVDNIEGKRYSAAILYTSLGYGLGPILGPYIGGILQEYVGWQANFFALAFISLFLFFASVLFIRESIPHRHSLHLGDVFLRAKAIFGHKTFLAGAAILGLIQIETMLYPTLGPFIVETVLQKSVLVYSKTALIIGVSYLSGTLLSRFLLYYFGLKRISNIAFIILFLSLISMVLITIFGKLSLTNLIFPLFILCLSGGMLFGNIMGANLRQFSEHAGIAMALQAMLLLATSSIGILIISHIHVDRLAHMTWIFLTIIFVETVLFFGCCRSLFRN